MRNLGLTFMLLPLVGLLIDYYIYRVVKARVAVKYRHRCLRVHAVLSLLLFTDAVVLLCMPLRTGGDDVLRAAMWMLFACLSCFVPKLLFTLIDGVACMPRLWHRRRIRSLSTAGVIIAVAVAAAMWWGALVNRFRINVNEVVVTSEHIPAAFDGYRIVQFSDFHVGTYGNDTAFVSRVVDRINALHPDMIVFTGDMVNRHSAEFEPFVRVMRRLSAPDGVIAILGNHDYGDYHTWDNAADKDADVANLRHMFADAGMTLLCDSAVNVIRDGEVLSVVGVNNISEPQFQTYGSLDKAYSHAVPGSSKILLSHNPEHWRRDISGRPFGPGNDFVLTLSGHTHAMQMEVAGLSPAVWVYPMWSGMYGDGLGHNLYVNIGLGTVGYPMRAGATPELTLFVLEP